jgi:hypothetical protein
MDDVEVRFVVEFGERGVSCKLTVPRLLNSIYLKLQLDANSLQCCQQANLDKSRACTKFASDKMIIRALATF